MGRAQPLPVPLQLLDDAQQVMRERGRLGRLRVRVGGEQGVPMPRGQFDERRAQIDARVDQADDELPLPQAVHRHVDVIAAAGGVKTAGDVLAAGIHQETFDVREEVFAGSVVRRLAYGGDGNRIERLSKKSGPGAPR